MNTTDIKPTPETGAPITPELIIAMQSTDKGGWTRATLQRMGVPWPPPKGWRSELIELWRNGTPRVLADDDSGGESLQKKLFP